MRGLTVLHWASVNRTEFTETSSCQAHWLHDGLSVRQSERTLRHTGLTATSMKDAHTKYFSSSVHQEVFRGKLTGLQTALNSSIPLLFTQKSCLYEYLLIQLHTGSVCIVQLFCLVSHITNENRVIANNSKKPLFTHTAHYQFPKKAQSLSLTCYFISTTAAFCVLLN